jgi:hypothetical protein
MAQKRPTAVHPRKIRIADRIRPRHILGNDFAEDAGPLISISFDQSGGRLSTVHCAAAICSL